MALFSEPGNSLYVWAASEKSAGLFMRSLIRILIEDPGQEQAHCWIFGLNLLVRGSYPGYTTSKAFTMSNLTLPFMFHPRYSSTWRPGRPWKSAGPQQYTYSASETPSTDEDTSEFLQYRKYKYGRSHQSSMNLLETMGKAQVNDEPWPSNSMVVGDEVRHATRQQQQVEEVRGLRPFSVGYPKETQIQLFNDAQSPATVSTTAPTSSRRPTHRPEPQVGRMLGLGGTTLLGPTPSRPQGPAQSSTATIRTTRAQELRTQAVRNGATATTPQGRTPNTSRGRTRGSPKPSSRRGTQGVNQSSSTARSHSNGVSSSSTPSSQQARSSTDERPGQVEGLLGQNFGGKQSRPSSENSVSVPSTVPDEHTNSELKDTLGATFQVGVEIEFHAALEAEFYVGPPRSRPVNDRYFIPLEEKRPTTVVDGLSARKHLAQLLRDAGIPAVSDHEQRDEVRQAAACFKGQLDQQDEHAFWNVKSEPAGMIMGLNADIFDYVGLEFASRKLHANAQGFKEIRDVLRILRRHFLVATSDICGVHVHVDAATLDFQERKNFLCLYLLAEKGLFELTAPHRRGDNQWCAPVFEKTKLAEEAKDILVETGAHHDEDVDPPRALKMGTMKELIQESATTEALQTAISRNMLPPFHRAALNLKDFGGLSYTFEFRHFQATLDPQVIEHFVRLCVALVISAKGLGHPGRPSFEDAYETFLNIKDWQDLLRIIGLESSMSHWERLLETYPAAPEDSLTESSHSEGDDRPSSFLPPLD